VVDEHKLSESAALATAHVTTSSDEEDHPHHTLQNNSNDGGVVATTTTTTESGGGNKERKDVRSAVTLRCPVLDRKSEIVKVKEAAASDVKKFVVDISSARTGSDAGADDEEEEESDTTKREIDSSVAFTSSSSPPATSAAAAARSAGGDVSGGCHANETSDGVAARESAAIRTGDGTATITTTTTTGQGPRREEVEKKAGRLLVVGAADVCREDNCSHGKEEEGEEEEEDGKGEAPAKAKKEDGEEKTNGDKQPEGGQLKNDRSNEEDRETKDGCGAEEEYVLQCIYCPSTYGRATLLRDHMRADHPEKPVRYQCPRCEQTFLLKSHLDKHLALHSPTSQACKVCQKTFANVYRLQRHMISHSESTDLRKFKCPECGKAFKFKHHLKEHIRIHSGEKPFQCPTCSKRFSHSGSYSSHMTSKKCWVMGQQNKAAQQAQGRRPPVAEREESGGRGANPGAAFPGQEGAAAAAAAGRFLFRPLGQVFSQPLASPPPGMLCVPSAFPQV
ncbi:zinc finger protein 92 homolog, partial [Aplysia californica]|uniref:Zinc finger protein 92 homolog n=1 Tax=Aplysia californica TaxID=6500 RepID=A0ABM1AE43_APLCA